MTRVVCMVQKGAEITAEVCVAAQVDERCFCIKAVTALQLVGDGDGMTLRDRSNLVTLRGRAAGMYRQPPEKRYAGPALRVWNERAAALAAITKPVAEAHTPEALKPEEGVLPPVEPMQAPTPGSPAGSKIREEVIAQAPQPVDVQRCCASDDCFTKIGNKSPHAKCHACRERDIRRSAVKARVCKAEGCTTHLRAPNHGDYCSICTKRQERSGDRLMTDLLPPLAEPIESLPGVVDAAVETVDERLRKDADDIAAFWRTGSMDARRPDPKTLPHDYLMACVQEARRRLVQLDEHFTFVTTNKEH